MWINSAHHWNQTNRGLENVVTHLVFPDNTVLCNFAAVSRLDLLERILLGRGRWSEAVAYEAGRSSAYLPDLKTLPVAG